VSINKFKAHLVVKGFTQIEGIECKETLSSVVRTVTIGLLLALVVHLNLELFQMDIKTLSLMKMFLIWLKHGFWRPLYVCQENLEGIMFLSLYIDDILFAGNNIEMIKATKH